jgi:hypothetical protein
VQGQGSSGSQRLFSIVEAETTANMVASEAMMAKTRMVDDSCA